MMTKTRKPIKVGLISLGCAKNLVDSEIMLGGVLKQGMEITSNADDADVLIVNTCSFIDSAKERRLKGSAGGGKNVRPVRLHVMRGGTIDLNGHRRA